MIRISSGCCRDDNPTKIKVNMSKQSPEHYTSIQLYLSYDCSVSRHHFQLTKFMNFYSNYTKKFSPSLLLVKVRFATLAQSRVDYQVTARNITFNPMLKYVKNDRVF